VVCTSQKKKNPNGEKFTMFHRMGKAVINGVAKKRMKLKFEDGDMFNIGDNCTESWI